MVAGKVFAVILRKKYFFGDCHAFFRRRNQTFCTASGSCFRGLRDSCAWASDVGACHAPACKTNLLVGVAADNQVVNASVAGGELHVAFVAHVRNEHQQTDPVAQVGVFGGLHLRVGEGVGYFSLNAVMAL